MRRRVTRFVPTSVLAIAFTLACGDGSTETASVVSLEVSAPGLFVPVGDSMRLTVQARDASGAPVAAGGLSWTSLDMGIATVDDRGMAYGVAPGVARITAAAGSIRDTFRLSVGGVMSFNVSTAAGCSLDAADFREAQLRASSDHALIYEDMSNPSGGFTFGEYQRIAATFDTLIHPVLTEAFGTPADIDRNGRVVILYTGAVNELTEAGSSSFVAGFHYSRDLLPKLPTGTMPGCAASNGAEMFFMLAPDPNGKLGNTRTRDFVLQRTLATVGHEYQHLINASRRLYETGAAELESVWLNEGMSHIAEELLFYRASGMSPLERIGANEWRASNRAVSAFNEFASSNFGRLSSYVAQPDEAGPYHSTDNLAGRGAAWSFLRYAADRSARAHQSIWMALASSTQAGFPNLDAAMGAATRPWIADWAVANSTDRYSISMTAHRFLHQSWRYHNTLGELKIPTLRVRALSGSSVIARPVVSGGSVHIAFRIGASGGGVFPRLQGSGGSSCTSGSERNLAVGDVLQGTLAQLSAICFAASSGGQNFVLTATHLSSVPAATVTFEISGTGLQSPSFAARTYSPGDSPGGPMLSMSPVQGADANGARSGFESELRVREKQELDRLLGRGVPRDGPSLQSGGVASDVMVSVVRVP